MKNSKIANELVEIDIYLTRNQTYKVTEEDVNICQQILIKLKERLLVSMDETDNDITNTENEDSYCNLKDRKDSDSSNGICGFYGDGHQDRYSSRDMDGSKGYHNYRESGRFGSHSMYDDMDDESMP